MTTQEYTLPIGHQRPRVQHRLQRLERMVVVRLAADESRKRPRFRRRLTRLPADTPAINNDDGTAHN